MLNAVDIVGGGYSFFYTPMPQEKERIKQVLVYAEQANRKAPRSIPKDVSSTRTDRKEIRMRCSVCGNVFCYSEADVKNNENRGEQSEMKKMIAVIMVLLMTALCVSCGESEKDSALKERIAGMTWIAKDHTEVTSSTNKKDVLVTWDDRYTVVFAEDNTCKATFERTSKFGEHYSSKTLRGKTDHSTDEWDCEWSVKVRGNKATVTLTSGDSFGMMPYVYTLQLDDSGKIQSISGTNKVNDPIVFHNNEGAKEAP